MKTLLFPMLITSSKGGMQQVVLDLLVGLQQKGYNCFFIGYKGCEVLQYYKQCGVKTVGIFQPTSFIQFIKFIFELYRVIRKHKNSLIITNDIYTHILLSFYIGKKQELFVSHGGDYRSKGSEFAAKTGYSAKIAKTFSFKRVRKFVAVSDTQKEALIYNARVPPRDVCVIYNGYNRVGDYNVGKDITASRIINLGVVGYIKRLKNQHILLDALCRLRDDGFNCVLNLYGSIADEEYYMELKQAIANKGLSEYVLFHGYVSCKDEIYLNTDVVISCSFHEGFGLSLIEAMAYRVPTIAYKKAAGPSVIIDNNKTGILVSENTSDEYYKALKELLSNSELYTQFQENAYEKYEECFSLSVMIEKYDTLIKSMTE